jgi:hypothetical protein
MAAFRTLGIISWTALVPFLAGCNGVLGIHEPGDWDGGTGTHPTPGRDAAPPPPKDGAPPTADARAPTGHSWATWPMPNPPSTGLPNPQSYDVATKEGVVVDNVTGLEWQAALEDTKYTWEEAGSYCAALDLDGGGFRLPSRIELLSIVDYTEPGPVIDLKIFRDTPGELFWTASPLVGDPSSAWSVNFGFATTIATTNMTTNTYRVRCVRSADTAGDRYTMENGTVLDARTKLRWQQKVEADPGTLAAAHDYCGALDLNGTGWRLPSVGELQTIVDEATSNPSVDTQAFPGTASEYFWSSSVLPRFSSFAWTVYFGFGLSTFFDVSQVRWVRCVHDPSETSHD